MPLITKEELNSQIKERRFAPIYVICGSEQMYVSGYTRKLAEAVAGKNPSEFNFHTFGGSVDLDTLAAAVEVVPFMSEYNCVLVTDIFIDEYNSDDAAKLKAICKRAVPGTVLIISMPSYVPKKNASVFESIFKRAQKDGCAIRFEAPQRKDIEKNIAKWANSRGKIIRQNTVSRLIAFCGTDLYRLKNEVEKLCAYTKGEEISYEAVDLLVAPTLETKIFALSDAVLAGRGDLAFNTLDRLFSQKEEPVVILYVLSIAFVDAYRVRVADESGVKQSVLSEDFSYGKRSFVLNNTRTAAKFVSTEALRKCLSVLAEADLKMKSVSMNERLLIEQLIARILMIAKEGKA